ncbi:MAG: hypothetical protein K0R18_482 [Bacillales bacterium]|jgi:hypothetical protein|nr:hypothetical protein [Bacillales bacterium]
MAGGFKKFGPTYNSTPFVRLGYEGTLNGAHDVSAAIVATGGNDGTGVTGELAGKFAAIKADGVGLATAGGKDAIGLFREDLGDMINASLKATFYFRGGEYYVSVSRTTATTATIAVGDQITSDANGKLVKLDLVANPTHKALGVCTHVGAFTAGNMYAHAGTAANGGDFIGFILFI